MTRNKQSGLIGTDFIRADTDITLRGLSLILHKEEGESLLLFGDVACTDRTHLYLNSSIEIIGRGDYSSNITYSVKKKSLPDQIKHHDSSYLLRKIVFENEHLFLTAGTYYPSHHGILRTDVKKIVGYSFDLANSNTMINITTDLQHYIKKISE